MRAFLAALAAGITCLIFSCADPNKPLDQSRIIAVRPAVPEGARQMIADSKRQQERLHRQPSAFNLFRRPASQGPGSARASSFGETLKRIFDPRQWGRKPAAAPRGPANATSPFASEAGDVFAPPASGQGTAGAVPAAQPASTGAGGQLDNNPPAQPPPARESVPAD